MFLGQYLEGTDMHVRSAVFPLSLSHPAPGPGLLSCLIFAAQGKTKRTSAWVPASLGSEGLNYQYFGLICFLLLVSPWSFMRVVGAVGQAGSRSVSHLSFSHLSLSHLSWQSQRLPAHSPQRPDSLCSWHPGWMMFEDTSGCSWGSGLELMLFLLGPAYQCVLLVLQSDILFFGSSLLKEQVSAFFFFFFFCIYLFFLIKIFFID